MPDLASVSRCGRGGGSAAPEDFLQRRKDERDIPPGTAAAHETNAERLSFEWSKPGADLDPIIMEQAVAHRCFVYTFRSMDRIQRGQ